jgi:hypothetical protein
MEYDSASAIKEQEERERKAIERIEKHNKDTKGV